MLKRILIIVTILAVLAAGAFTWYRYFRPQEKVALSQAIDAIPESAVFLVEWKSLASAKELSGNSEIPLSLKRNGLLDEYFQNLDLIDSLLKRDTSALNFFNKQAFLFSAHPSGVKKFNFLFTSSLPSEITIDKIREIIRKASNGGTIIERAYEGKTVYELKNGETTSLSFSIVNSLLIMSRSTVLVEESIRHLLHGTSIRNNPGFRKIIDASKGRESGVIYINHEKLPSWSSLFLQVQIAKELQITGQFASVTGADIKIKKDAILLNGYVFSDDTTNNYLNIFKGQKPQSTDFTEHLPATTAFCFWQGIQELKSWHRKYYGWLENSNRLFNVQNSLAEFNGRRKSKFPEDLNAFSGHEFFCFIEEQSAEDTLPSSFIFGMQVTDAEKAIKYFKGLSGDIQDTAITKDGDLEIIPVQLGKLFSLTGLCPVPVESNYMMNTGNYLFFAQDPKTLEKVARSVNDGNIFSKTIANKDMQEYLSDEACLLSFAVPFRSSAFNEQIFQLNENNGEELQKLYSGLSVIAFQVSQGKELFYQDVVIRYNPEAERQQIPAWELELAEAGAYLQVAGEGEEERIFVQTTDHVLEVYASDGTLAFTKQLSSPLIGNVTAIKPKQGDVLFLAVEKDQLHLWNINGTASKGFPYKLQEGLDAPVAVFDYDKTGEFRLIFGSGGKIRNIQPNGNKAQNWPEDLNVRLTGKAEHMKIAGKDHLLLPAEDGITVTDRKGKFIRKISVRGLTGSLTISKIGKSEVLVFSTKEGKLFYCNPEKETVTELNKDLRIKPQVFYKQSDLDKDRKREHIIADSMAINIYSDSLKLVNSFPFSGSRSLEIRNVKDRNILYSHSHSDSAIAIGEGSRVLPGFPAKASGVAFSQGGNASGYYILRGKKFLKFTIPR